MPSKQCFPTLIYSEKALDAKKSSRFLKELVDDSFKIAENDREGVAWSEINFCNGYTSFTSLPRLDELCSSFLKLKKIIDKHVWNFAKDLEFDRDPKSLEMNSFWLNILNKNGYHSLHLHPHSVISGTFYLHTPPGSGQLRFEDPRLSRFMLAPQKKEEASMKNSPFLFFKGSPGKIVLFESWLRHEVEQNHSEKPRLSVSFNYS